ncbi:MAG TPA: C-terminal helicase domain-containing protein, partial [Candidatus Nanoarchaeia archaeon]|nr:C-terminal helicase domain-containing protein [Candidatus Nanoarchaeia archaeon]
KEHNPPNGLIQARKAILDPRLVDPTILKRAGVLGSVTPYNSAKYKDLEEQLTAVDGPLLNNEKFLIFTLLKEGVTKANHNKLKKEYERMGEEAAFKKLHLEKSLEILLEEAVEKRIGKKIDIAVIDGSLSQEKRDRIIDNLNKDISGVIATTKTGGESNDYTAASWIFILEEDYSPDTEVQGIARVVRKGQKRKVKIRPSRATNTLDESLHEYVTRKKIINTIALDGLALTEEEESLLSDGEGKLLWQEERKRGMGGTSIDVASASFGYVDDVATKVKNRKTMPGKVEYLISSEYKTTDAQLLNKLIGEDPLGCWKDPKFVELYMKVLPTLAVSASHRAKILDLVRRAKEQQIEFPKKVLADGSGPSILYDAYQNIVNIVRQEGFKVPRIYDRDTSQLMLNKGTNPNKILGNMTGENSSLKKGSFSMVDNQSISLLRNQSEVKKTILESNRVLKEDGLLHLGVHNLKFMKEFYPSLEKAGFKVLSEKNEGYVMTKAFFRQLKEEKGEHFASSFRNKLNGTQFILAQKKDKPGNVSEEGLWFERISVENEKKSMKSAQEELHKKNLPTPTTRERKSKQFRKNIVTDDQGFVISSERDK